MVIEIPAAVAAIAVIIVSTGAEPQVEPAPTAA
jgi:hypothetical protein